MAERTNTEIWLTSAVLAGTSWYERINADFNDSMTSKDKLNSGFYMHLSHFQSLRRVESHRFDHLLPKSTFFLQLHMIEEVTVAHLGEDLLRTRARVSVASCSKSFCAAVSSRGYRTPYTPPPRILGGRMTSVKHAPWEWDCQQTVSLLAPQILGAYHSCNSTISNSVKKLQRSSI